MKTSRYLVLVALLLAAATTSAADLLDRSFRPLTGKQPVDLAQTYGGQVLLIVNTASKCGLAPQFEGLEALYARYKAQGFAVLASVGDFVTMSSRTRKRSPSSAR